MKKLIILLIIFITGVTTNAQIIIDEGFEDVFIQGYFSLNLSEDPNGDGFFQGDPLVFPAFDGPTNSYLAVDSNATATSGATIDWWGLTPLIDYQNGDIISFYTRTQTGSVNPDRLEIRIDPDGIGNFPTSGNPGSYTNLLLSINPDLEISGYPEEWTLQTITISGLPAGTTVPTRIAFRYWVTDAGPGATNSNYIGIDRIVIEDTTLGIDDIEIEGLVMYPNPTTNILNIEAATIISSIEVFNVLGQSLFSETVKANTKQIDVSEFQTGSYFVKVTTEGGSKVIKVQKK